MAPRTSSTHVPQAYAEVVSLNPHPRNPNEPPRQKSFAFCERVRPIPQPQALEISFKDGVQDYMAAHTEIMERFENAIFKQREEINDRMAKMFELLKELTASRTPKKVLVREEARHPITKNVNSISLIRIKEEKSVRNNRVVGKNIVESNKPEVLGTLEEVDREGEVRNRTNNESAKNTEKDLTEGKMEYEAYHSLPVEPMRKAMLKKMITKKEDMGAT
ncbi:hypothetical protein Tco_0919907, partial [Tanacetum coccineum]